MKKLFFSALVAIVAVGGAYATSSLAPIVYAPGSSTPIDCGGTFTLCSTITGSTFAYTVPASSGNQNSSTRIILTAAHKIHQNTPN